MTEQEHKASALTNPLTKALIEASWKLREFEQRRLEAIIANDGRTRSTVENNAVWTDMFNALDAIGRPEWAVLRSGSCIKAGVTPPTEPVDVEAESIDDGALNVIALKCATSTAKEIGANIAKNVDAGISVTHIRDALDEARALERARLRKAWWREKDNKGPTPTLTNEQIDVDGIIDMRGIEYVGKATKQANGTWRCLAKINGGLFVVEVNIGIYVGLRENEDEACPMVGLSDPPVPCILGKDHSGSCSFARGQKT